MEVVESWSLTRLMERHDLMKAIIYMCCATFLLGIAFEVILFIRRNGVSPKVSNDKTKAEKQLEKPLTMKDLLQMQNDIKKMKVFVLNERSSTEDSIFKNKLPLNDMI